MSTQILIHTHLRPGHRAVDYAVKIRVNPQQTGIDLNVKHSMVRVLEQLSIISIAQAAFHDRTLLMRLVCLFTSPRPVQVTGTDSSFSCSCRGGRSPTREAKGESKVYQRCNDWPEEISRDAPDSFSHGSRFSYPCRVGGFRTCP